MNRTREDTLSGYNVYQVNDGGADTLITTTTDTSAIIVVDANYQEYCHYVKAVWDTDTYGTLESRSSNSACAVPYKLGDADFDSDVDITDVLKSLISFLKKTARAMLRYEMLM